MIKIKLKNHQKGGIVDRNRLKGATHTKAIQQNIRTAKLPIKEYFTLCATHILTVNHVFEILLNYSISKNWKNAIELALPKRKVVENNVNVVSNEASKNTIFVEKNETENDIQVENNVDLIVENSNNDVKNN